MNVRSYFFHQTKQQTIRITLWKKKLTKQTRKGDLPKLHLTQFIFHPRHQKWFLLLWKKWNGKKYPFKYGKCFLIWTKQKSYKRDNQLITWLTGITRTAGSCNLVTLKTNFAQYKNFVWFGLPPIMLTCYFLSKLRDKHCRRCPRLGYLGCFFLWILFSCSLVVIKRSLNDNCFC